VTPPRGGIFRGEAPDASHRWLPQEGNPEKGERSGEKHILPKEARFPARDSPKINKTNGGKREY